MLDILETALGRHNFTYAHYDGKMTPAARDASVRGLFENPDMTVMLVSLRCGEVGLNLTAASRVILPDVWWNPGELCAVQSFVFGRWSITTC